MWSTLNSYTLGEPAWTELEVCFSGTPDYYYKIEAQKRAERMQARAEQAPIAEALNREAAVVDIPAKPR